MSLHELYEAFSDRDRTEEIGNGRPEVVNRVWKAWHKISYKVFLEHVWKLQFCDGIQDAVRHTGTINLALRYLAILSEFGYVTVEDTGSLDWNRLPLGTQDVSHLTGLEDPFPDFKDRTDLGQFRARWSSSVRRATKILGDLPPSETRVFLCGDDDFTGIALAHLGFKVCVGDIDENVLTRITSYCQVNQLDLSTLFMDVRHPAPEEIRGRFDAFYCDPFDNGYGIDLWIQKANEVLTGEIGNRIYINVSLSRVGARMVGLQNFLTSQGFALVEIQMQHSYYKFPDNTDPHAGNVFEIGSYLGIDSEVIKNLDTHTDLLAFRRQMDRVALWPQSYVEVRRKL